ncbi:uncharacterized protein [Ambystoma mexicanum]|uniref:uncharacterized protein n=1 Tax=Ambystoma mexicanum TaxID=8296 RepID=UPI0037E76066
MRKGAGFHSYLPSLTVYKLSFEEAPSEMPTSRSPKKTKRSYSLRTPRAPRSPAFLDTYDRLEEIDYHDASQSGNPSGDSEASRFSFSGHLGDPNAKSPLIVEEPKEVRSKRKRRARSLRVTKTESRAFLVEHTIYNDLDALSKEEAHTTAEEEPVPSDPAQVTCCLGMDDGQQLIEGCQESREANTEREKQKSNKMKQYKKTIDRAFRRGWENFVSNLYTVSLSRSASPSAGAPPPLVKAC